MRVKQRIDTGVRNNPSTGDVLADGGDKINNGIDDIYDKFGDTRISEVGHGIDKQTIHATGYYQKYKPTYYARVVEMGSMHDIDTTTGSIVVKLPKVKIGESIEFINSNGSITSAKNLMLQCESTDSFVGGDGSKIFRTPHSKIIVWGVNDYSGRGTWDYSIDNLFYQNYTAVDIDAFIKTTGTVYTIANISDYRAMKFIIHCQDDIQKKSKSSEMLLHINRATGKLYHAEYAVVGNNPEDLFDIEFYVEGEDIKMNVKTKIGNNARFIMKSTDNI